MAGDAVPRGYRPIEDYAAVGDCHGAALVARDGDVDWCCLRRFDADPCFYRLLDANKGGFLSTRQRNAVTTARHYVDHTNILRTELTSAAGRVQLTDFMPVGRKPGASAHDYIHLNAPCCLVRCIEVLSGEVDLEIIVRASADFSAPGAAPTATVTSSMSLGATGGSVRMKAGERHFIVIGGDGARNVDAALVEHWLQVTAAFWHEWIMYCRYRGPHVAAVQRSALALKLLCYAPTGTIAAALTTSLPEAIGGTRNWDYRYCWVRDASLMLIALAALGYSGEARQFHHLLSQAAADGPERLQVGFGLELERDVPERDLAHLEGYLASKPVRVGNGAFDQSQSDLYAYVLEAALAFRDLGGHPCSEDQERFARLVDFVAGCWRKPDQGIWEARGAPRHFVHSKAMCWAAMDRGIALFGERPEWVRVREEILQSLLAQGAGPGGFRRAYADQTKSARTEECDTDGSLLVLPLLGLPRAADLCERTLDTVQLELMEGDFVRRYRGEDGIDGGPPEGAFLACSFWLVDALLAANRFEPARTLFERLLKHSNDVGLYAEEADPASGRMLGNFPQALTHLALIISAVNLDLHEKHGAAGLRGGPTERARRAVGATLGWRGVFAAFWRSRMGIKLFSSRRSQMIL